MRRLIVVSALICVCYWPVLGVTAHRIPSLNAGLLSIFGGKKQAPPGWVLHKQTVSVGDISLKTAERKCANWTWVAGMVDMAATQGAKLEQQYLVDRLYGGSVCLGWTGDPQDLAQRISHDYVLQDGQKFDLSAQFTPGVPSQPDPLIMTVRQHRPIMMFWRSHPYLLTGLDYDEYTAPTGNKMFIITALKLFDPGAEEGKRQLVFDREHDDPGDIDGVLGLSVHTR